ncbi:TrmH family RNA methyltransferase [Bartonella tamiae]|uniref:RNA methyltransferase, TrmH family, group 3 n=1 Tax=Bartonella tamiae Th239 TaxID=1094558 RepID=J1K029_9HYPH|nr:RNA methyltransferase [Bartonella tamiae]EJF90752.1 RNA methyltransferase, TrmH family, group 3 [Bartonella tamiae Th239]EJF93871.1 RNA methyltransferase, TrmH family, group 3 [Bartonella tamiae Th307]
MNTKTPKDSHYARLRRQHRASLGKNPAKKPTKRIEPKPYDNSELRLYGLHTVRAALSNPKRNLIRLFATQNALSRLDIAESSLPCPFVLTSPKELDILVGNEAVHQGIVLETLPLKTRRLSQLANAPLLILLDQVTDPHNVGAVMRSAVAFNASALITTHHHSAKESGVLAKSASGALELIDHISVRNLSETLIELHDLGFLTIGLDSQGEYDLEKTLNGDKIALVLGAEGKGLRQKTRETVNALARLDMPGQIKSLNVSNAAAISFYLADRHLKR